MKKEHKREIRQLWFIADYYLKMAKRNKSKLTTEDLSTAIGDIAKTDERFDKSEFEGCEKSIMLFNANLASCAIRLNTIDEILGKHYTSTRWYFYEGLIAKDKNFLKKNDIKDNLKIIAHCLLRHNTAHREKQPADIEGWRSTMEKALHEVTIGELYENMELVIKSIKNDIAEILSAQT